MFKKVLFPIYKNKEDLETSQKAIQFALGQKSQMVILSVSEPQTRQMHEAASMASLLHLTRELFQKAGLSCDLIEKEGNPTSVICKTAKAMNVDVIVMGTKGINLSADHDSIPASVIRFAPCPVLVVP